MRARHVVWRLMFLEAAGPDPEPIAMTPPEVTQ